MYREVTMLEVKEVLRLWREGVPTKGIAAQVGLGNPVHTAGLTSGEPLFAALAANSFLLDNQSGIPGKVRWIASYAWRGPI